MKYPDYLLWLPLAAFVLDLLLGDPRPLPHPVRLIGRFFSNQQERVLKERFPRLSGFDTVLFAMFLSGLAVGLLVWLPYGLGVFFALYFAYAGLAMGCLLREGRAAARRIETGSIEEARAAVAMLVSRDVSALERPALYKTLAESLSENFTDAFAAPYFWLCFFGPVGLWVYKAASTADSMWGYKHEPFTRLGWGAAKIDDLMAYIPARLSVLFLYLGAVDKSSWPGRDMVAAQARLMESPNAGWSMAAAAWLHGAAMGGPAIYAGELKEKPRLGPAGGSWDFQKIKALERHLLRSGLVGALALWAVSLILLACYALIKFIVI